VIDDVVARMRGEWYRLRYRVTSGGRVQIGKGFRAYSAMDLGGPGRIRIGENVTVRKDPFNHRSVSLHTMYSSGAEIVIEAEVRLAGTHISAGKMVKVERGAWVEDARIMDSDMHVVTSDAGSRHQDSVADARDVVIGENATVGSGAMLLKGATVGRGSLVRPGSVVMRPTPEDAILAGFPARPEEKG